MLWFYQSYRTSGDKKEPKASPEAEEQGTGLLAHLVVWDDVSKGIAHIPEVLQHRIALLPLTHQDGIGVHLHS